MDKTSKKNKVIIPIQISSDEESEDDESKSLHVEEKATTSIEASGEWPNESPLPCTNDLKTVNCVNGNGDNDKDSSNDDDVLITTVAYGVIPLHSASNEKSKQGGSSVNDDHDENRTRKIFGKDEIESSKDVKIAVNKEFNPNQSSLNKRRKHPHKINSLRQRLAFYAKEIKRLSESELSLDEMNESSSRYLQECEVKRKYLEVHKKLCKLRKTCDPLENCRLHNIKIIGSPYPEINREAEIFVSSKQQGWFPDFFDIRNIVKKANIQYNIGLKTSEEDDCAGEVFSEIGDKLQKKRKKDFARYSGSYLTDCVPLDNDPALTDKELRRKLKKNHKIARDNLEHIFRHFSGRQIGCTEKACSIDNDDDYCVTNSKAKQQATSSLTRGSSKCTDDEEHDNINDSGQEINIEEIPKNVPRLKHDGNVSSKTKKRRVDTEAVGDHTKAIVNFAKIDILPRIATSVTVKHECVDQGKARNGLNNGVSNTNQKSLNRSDNMTNDIKQHSNESKLSVNDIACNKHKSTFKVTNIKLHESNPNPRITPHESSSSSRFSQTNFASSYCLKITNSFEKALEKVKPKLKQYFNEKSNNYKPICSSSDKFCDIPATPPNDKKKINGIIIIDSDDE